MQTKEFPFNIDLLKVDGNFVRNLRPVTSTDIMGSSGQQLGSIDTLKQAKLAWQGTDKVSSNFNPEGLFSTEIFGRVGETMRDRQFSYVDIKVPVFHPLIYKTLHKIKSLYTDLLAGKAYATWNTELKDFEVSDELNGETGFLFFVKYWNDIVFPQSGSPAREQRIRLIEKYRDRALTDKVLVLPAGLRDVREGAGQRLEFDEINDVYRRIVGISNTVAGGGDRVTSPALNYSRYQLQMAFNEVYAMVENLLRDKGGFLQRRWTRRRVFDTTRNVISSMDTSRRYLGDNKGPRATDTILGFYQTLAGVRPLAINLIRNGWLAEVFDVQGNSTVAQLVNPKTWERERVDVGSIVKDRWTTIDGLQKVINSFADENNRHRAVKIQEYYVGLIYRGPDATFRIFGDITELPEELSRDCVTPLSLVELLYLSGYQTWNTLKVINTRYPVTGVGSTYPADLYVKTTSVAEKRYELGPDWNPLGDDFVAPEFPRADVNSFTNSISVSPTRVAGLGADFDGDTTSALIVYSEESKKEIDITLHSREAYTDPAGGVRTSVQTDTLALVLRNMTGDYPTTPY